MPVLEVRPRPSARGPESRWSINSNIQAEILSSFTRQSPLDPGFPGHHNQLIIRLDTSGLAGVYIRVLSIELDVRLLRFSVSWVSSFHFP